MVQLEEVADEAFLSQQPGPKENEDDWDTDDDASEVSDIDDDDDTLDESLMDRFAALADIVPPTYRKSISNAASTGYSWATKGLSLSGKTLWIVSTSALLLGVPWAMAFAEEQQVQEMEREMRMQQNANDLLTSGTGAGQAGVKPAL